MKKTEPRQALKERTMLLMYLTRFDEKVRSIEVKDKAWKGYNFNIIDELDEEELIFKGSYQSKSITIDDKGLKYAKKLLDKYHIQDWDWK